MLHRVVRYGRIAKILLKVPVGKRVKVRRLRMLQLYKPLVGLFGWPRFGARPGMLPSNSCSSFVSVCSVFGSQAAQTVLRSKDSLADRNHVWLPGSSAFLQMFVWLSLRPCRFFDFKKFAPDKTGSNNLENFWRKLDGLMGQ